MQKNQLYILNFYKLYIEPTHFNSKIIIERIVKTNFLIMSCKKNLSYSCKY